MPRPGELPDHAPEYLPTRSMHWLNDALGKGFARGSVCLLSGDSGIGKSTLALQAVGDLAQQGLKCLYLTSEQELRDLEATIHRVVGSPHGRLPDGVGCNLHLDDRVGDLTLLPEFLERHVLSPDGEYHGSRAIVIDSIQGRGLSSSAANSYKALYAFGERAKAAGIVTILIGHVTKEGHIAGPKTLQHNVDVVLHMQRAFILRPLFVPKNRFGPATLDPIVLEMDGVGRVVQSPHAAAETATVLGYGGLTTELAEVQALVSLPKFGASPIFNAPDLPRQKLRQILRIIGGLEGIGLAEMSHEVNAYVPGGRKYLQELDLPLAVSLLASYLKLPLPKSALFAGEVDLNGTIRPLNAFHRQELATLLIRKQDTVERVFVSDRDVEEFASLGSYERRVGEVVAVHGVSDLTNLIQVLWPKLLAS